jgi:hypothetical protein
MPIARKSFAPLQSRQNLAVGGSFYTPLGKIVIKPIAAAVQV